MVPNTQGFSGKQPTKLVVHAGEVQLPVFPRVSPMPLNLRLHQRQKTKRNAWIIPQLGLTAVVQSITANNGTQVKKIYAKTLVLRLRTSALQQTKCAVLAEVA